MQAPFSYVTALPSGYHHTGRIGLVLVRPQPSGSYPLVIFIAICHYIDMICVYCLTPDTSVVNSRPHKKHPHVWRRRRCATCHRTFTSYEEAAPNHLWVVPGSQCPLPVQPRSSTMPQAQPTPATQQTPRRPKGAQEFSLGTLTVSINQAFTHCASNHGSTSYNLARTAVQQLARRAAQAQQYTISTADIAHTTHHILKRYDPVAALQYGARHGMVTSLRRRGRPSTTATSGGN